MSDADRLKQITELQDLLAAANARADKAELEAVGWAEEANALRAEAHDRHIVQAKATDEVRALRERITELEELNATAVQLADSSDEKKWEVVKQRVEWQGRAEIAEARIDKALALHRETHWNDTETMCEVCQTDWPCATVRALSDTAGPEDTALDDFRIDNPEAGT